MSWDLGPSSPLPILPQTFQTFSPEFVENFTQLRHSVWQTLGGCMPSSSHWASRESHRQFVRTGAGCAAVPAAKRLLLDLKDVEEEVCRVTLSTTSPDNPPILSKTLGESSFHPTGRKLRRDGTRAVAGARAGPGGPIISNSIAASHPVLHPPRALSHELSARCVAAARCATTCCWLQLLATRLARVA